VTDKRIKMVKQNYNEINEIKYTRCLDMRTTTAQLTSDKG